MVNLLRNYDESNQFEQNTTYVIGFNMPKYDFPFGGYIFVQTG